MKHDDLTAAVLVGVAAASAHQLAAADRITRQPRWWLIRRLRTTADRHPVAWHALYGLGCWDCGPMWWSTLFHLLRRRPRSLVRLLVLILASRAIARYSAHLIGWHTGEWVPVALPDGRIGLESTDGRDWPPEVSWTDVRAH